MGRHAGFLTASSALLKTNVADDTFNLFTGIRIFFSKFLRGCKTNIQEIWKMYNCNIRRIQDKNKKLISQIVSKKKEYDAHGNIQLSGSGSLGDF